MTNEPKVKLGQTNFKQQTNSSITEKPPYPQVLDVEWTELFHQPAKKTDTYTRDGYHMTQH